MRPMPDVEAMNAVAASLRQRAGTLGSVSFRLEAQTAGMATRRPPAVVRSASAIPAETEAIPPPDLAMPSNARMMPMTVPNRPTNGAVAPMVARTPRFSFSSATVIMAVRSMPWRAVAAAGTHGQLASNGLIIAVRYSRPQPAAETCGLSDIKYTYPLIRTADTSIYGRTTFEMMEGYWPGMVDDPKASEGERGHAR